MSEKQRRSRGQLSLRDLRELFVDAPAMAVHHYANRDPKRGKSEVSR